MRFSMFSKAIPALVAGVIAMSSCCNQTTSHPGPITTGDDSIAQTIYGKVQGYCDDGIYTFKGIRYAKADRFMPPQYPDSWEGVQKAQVYGPKAMQGQNVKYNTPTDYDFGFQFKIEFLSEDCQVLNVWTPALDGKKRPVFLWIHGGGYANGSAIFLPAQDGRSLAEKGDIVVVTVNHRLNLLGYLDLSPLGGKYSESVNLGMQDLVKALEWVHSNIEAFGGDPDCVTIGGQSGGGGKVSTLCAMPSAEGLFHRAIVQSGSTLRQAEKDNSPAMVETFLSELGLTPATADKLAEIPYETLEAAANKASRASGGRLSPVVDGKYLVQHPFDPMAADCSRNVPMLIGSNLNEFNYQNNVEYSEDTRTRGNVLNQAAAKMAAGGAPAYVYLFSWKSEVNDGALAACHGMELPFMFANVAAQREMTGGTESAYAMEEKVSSAWISFIKTGDPNCKQLPKWDVYDPEKESTMVLADDCHMQYKQ
ncbi:MAG: carboxylesterase family protein [Bacteroidales bacterium]|nr:carboxylesterase family protein [Bacteroidales bacterium]